MHIAAFANYLSILTKFSNLDNFRYDHKIIFLSEENRDIKRPLFMK